MSRHFSQNAEIVAEGIRQTYPDYDQEMARTLVRHISEGLNSFLPIRMAGIGNTEVGGEVTLKPE